MEIKERWYGWAATTDYRQWIGSGPFSSAGKDQRTFGEFEAHGVRWAGQVVWLRHPGFGCGDPWRFSHARRSVPQHPLCSLQLPATSGLFSHNLPLTTHEIQTFLVSCLTISPRPDDFMSAGEGPAVCLQPWHIIPFLPSTSLAQWSALPQAPIALHTHYTLIIYSFIYLFFHRILACTERQA